MYTEPTNCSTPFDYCIAADSSNSIDDPGGTNTPGAIVECVKIFEEQGRIDVPRVTVVFTDGVTHYSGRSNNYDQRQLEEASADALAANVTTYGIAFGSRVEEVIGRATMELLTITGNNPDHFFIAKTVNELANVISLELTSIIGCCECHSTLHWDLEHLVNDIHGKLYGQGLCQ